MINVADPQSVGIESSDDLRTSVLHGVYPACGGLSPISQHNFVGFNRVTSVAFASVFVGKFH